MSDRYRYEWILEEIRAGVVLPDRWPEGGEGDQEQGEKVEPEYTRWWEQENTEKGANE